MIAVSIINDNNPVNNKGIRYGEYEYVADYDNRFPDDKVCFHSDDYILLLDGLVLNRVQLLKENPKFVWAEYLIDLYRRDGEKFFAQLRGSFVGALYDVKRNKWIIFKDHLGSYPIFYANNGQLCVSSDITYLYNTMKQNGVKLNLDPIGIQMMFDCDLAIDGYTICKEVRWLHPGCYLVYENNRIEEKQFYEFTRNEIQLSSEDEYLDMIDEAFCNAIKTQFSKDDEYGYKTITLLSGGMDSRMVVWMAHQLGWNKQLNITFANSGSYDETIAHQIAKDLCHEWLFKPLEDGNFMYLVDDCTLKTGGNMTFTRMVLQLSSLRLIDFEGAKYGALHTGTKGEFLKGDEASGGHTNVNSNYYLDYLNKIGVTPFHNYSDPELFSIISREFFNRWGLDQSPFMELDFFEITMKIPTKLRLNEYIYKQWVCKRHSDANKYAWATTGLPYGSKRFNPKVPYLHCYLHQLPKYISYKMGKNGFGMNPWLQFYNNNKGLKPFYEDYAKYLDAIEDDKIRDKMEKSLFSNNLVLKFKAVTVLSAVKMFFS